MGGMKKNPAKIFGARVKLLQWQKILQTFVRGFGRQRFLSMVEVPFLGGFFSSLGKVLDFFFLREMMVLFEDQT